MADEPKKQTPEQQQDAIEKLLGRSDAIPSKAKVREEAQEKKAEAEKAEAEKAEAKKDSEPDKDR